MERYTVKWIATKMLREVLNKTRSPLNYILDSYRFEYFVDRAHSKVKELITKGTLKDQNYCEIFVRTATQKFAFSFLKELRDKRVEIPLHPGPHRPA